MENEELNGHLDQIVSLVRDTNQRTIDIEKHLKEINGTIARHNEEIFGNKNSTGIIKELEDLHDFAVSTRSAAKVMITLISVIGVGNIILVITLVAKIGEHTG